jgi:MoaA/NifB/PqqE/SkfB family radical SAM enzyme
MDKRPYSSAIARRIAGGQRQLPDLIWAAGRRERSRLAWGCLASRQLRVPQTIDRVTIFATYRCNLRCRYCNTVRSGCARPGGRRDFDLERLFEVGGELMDHDVRHAHFTGGEATLVPDLPRMVAFFSRRGIPCSLTTNGTAAPELYRELVGRGLREVRISLDTHDAAEMDRLVRRRGTYRRVVATIRELVRLREAGRDVYVIVNCCVGRANRARVPELVRRTLELGVDDMKLLSIAQEREDLARFEERHRMVARAREVLAEYPPESFPLLRVKLRTVFAADVCGLGDLASERVFENCLVPLTERTWDAGHYYPCPVYAREGGEPLGDLDWADLEDQQQRTLKFSREHSCAEDPICRRYCIGCCKSFNLDANARHHHRVHGRSGGCEPLAATVDYTGEISDALIAEVSRRIAEERRGYPLAASYRPFLVIKPGGMAHRERILALLGEAGVRVAETRALGDWNRLALRLYTDPLSDGNVYRGLLLLRVLPQLEGRADAQLLVLAGSPSPADLAVVKRRVRAALPPVHYAIFHEGRLTVTTPGYLHSPDGEAWFIEAGTVLG